MNYWSRFRHYFCLYDSVKKTTRENKECLGIKTKDILGDDPVWQDEFEEARDMKKYFEFPYFMLRLSIVSSN
jgi:hypothetical protein